jgi:diguanylate cyclase (GGDEF)-like protein
MKKLADLISASDVGEMLEHIRALIVLVERDGTLVSWNRAFEKHKAKSPLAEKLQDYFSQKEKDKICDKLGVSQQDRFVIEFGVDEDARTIFYDCLLIPLASERALFIAEHVNTDTSLQNIVQNLEEQIKVFQAESDFIKKFAHNKQIEINAIMAQANELSHVDALTFLPNRRLIVRELQNEVLRAVRYNSQLSISVADVDFFKKVNDTHGHIAGDEILRHVAHQLRDHIRHPDLVGRYGGEEFLILLPNTNAIEAAEQAARLCKYVRETQVQVNGHALSVTISIGVAQFQHGVDTWDTLLNRADNAMYEAKKNGRDRWTVAE